MNLKTKTVWKSIAVFLLLVWALTTIIPLYWMMIGSFQDSLSSATYEPQMIPSVWSVAPYERFFN